MGIEFFVVELLVLYVNLEFMSTILIDICQIGIDTIMCNFFIDV